MDFSQPVKLVIEAIDRTKLVVAGIQSRLAGLSSGGSGSFSGVGQAGQVSGLAIGAGFAAANLAINTVTQSVQMLTGSMQEAIKSETQFITTASGLANALGTPISNAKTLLDSLQNDLSIAAAELPGENRDYIAVLNQVSDTIAKEYRGDMEGFKKAVKDITIRTAALASTIPGLSGDAAGMTIERLISGGGGWGELKQLDLFQKNAPLRDAIEKGAQEEGVTMAKWQQLTTKKRLAIVNKALSKVATDELFNEFSGTADSLIQGMKSKLFDMRTGIFGLMRDVDSREDRSALDAFTEVLKRVRNLAAAGNRLAHRVGFVVDPMESLIDFFDGVNQLLGQIAFIMDTSLPGMEFNNIATYLGQWVTDLASSAVEGLMNFDTSWLANLHTTISHYLDNVNWYKVGEMLGVTIYKLALSAIRGIPGTIMNLAKLGSALVGIVIGLAIGVAKALADSLYKLFVKPIEDFLKTIGRWIARIFGLLPQIPRTAPQIVNTVTNVASAITNPAGFIGQKIGQMLVGGKKETTTTPPGNPNADKVNTDNKVKPVTPVKTSQGVSNTNTTTNTIQSLTVSANSLGDAQGIANVIIDELNARLGFRMAQQLA